MIEQTNLSQFIEEYESQFVRHPNINYTLISDEESVKIGNENYTKVSYMMESNNYFLYMDSYFRIVGDRVIMITLTFDDEAVRDDILDAFTAY